LPHPISFYYTLSFFVLVTGSVTIFENHLHLRRDGRYIEAVKDFAKAGGTHLVLCQYPMPELVLAEKSYMSIYADTLKMTEEIMAAVPVKVFAVVGPYPVDYLTFQENMGRDEAMALMKKGMDEAAQLCLEHRCIAIGEIGRPHFPVSPEIMRDSTQILQYGMQRAKEVGVPVVLHTETTTPASCKEFVELGRGVGLVADQIVKHFAPPLVTPEENFGLMPSVLSSKKNIVTALSKGSRFLMETDYIDDLRRPGAVLGPATVPTLTKTLLQRGVMTEAQAEAIHRTNPEKTYHISLK
jgi:TatD-related deoxyribonuclease